MLLFGIEVLKKLILIVIVLLVVSYFRKWKTKKYFLITFCIMALLIIAGNVHFNSKLAAFDKKVVDTKNSVEIGTPRKEVLTLVKNYDHFISDTSTDEFMFMSPNDLFPTPYRLIVKYDTQGLVTHREIRD